ncbi:unnamed protein product [Rangifer tarandus platyrhynchus]|uniref:Uncharacterized protein n=2 Tax=Rangifer tarandus platyrhynchus TaxID=3082113 RepID=A0ACB0EM07_RANTA|nr:unnamed protein product [Rangifer tarandus platyrhynchus]CAI9701121.1 unnamed protein product [Rangifer tarandus platyrhynchus]
MPVPSTGDPPPPRAVPRSKVRLDPGERKRGLAGRDGALQREPPRARLPLPPGASGGKCGPPNRNPGPGRRPPGGPALGELEPGVVVAGRRASLKASEGSWSGERLGGDGGAPADWGRLGAAVPGGDAREAPAPRARSSLGPAPRSLGALRPHPQLAQPAGAATRLRALPPARGPGSPLAPRSRPVTPAGHARRPAKPAPRPAAPAPAPQATPPGLSALRPSPSPAPVARYFHTSRCPGPGA